MIVLIVILSNMYIYLSNVKFLNQREGKKKYFVERH